MSHSARTTAKTALSVLVVILAAAGLLLHADVPRVPSNFWAPAGDMASIRAGASGTLLPNGLVLVAGGLDANGATSSVERFSPDGAHFIDAPSMQMPRANHTATLLADGRVLVAGGTGASGAADATAEIYDSAANAWVPAGSLNVARRGHTATRLPDGKVLIAGGDDNGVAIDSLEVFDPDTALFTIVDGASASARTLHAAAALLDGRVLIAGGFDGTNPLASTSIYDPETNTVSAGPDLSTPRSGLTATTLLDGRVLIAGGAGISGELASAEIFDPATNAFTATDNTLSSARQNHLAFLLPHNNQVLIVGGLAGGNAVGAAEYFTPWEGTNGVFCAQAICASGYQGPAVPATARAWSAGSALSFPADATYRSGPNDGLLVLAGGKDQKSSELFGFATVRTDKDDYAPGTTVTITGSGWKPHESVALVLRESPLFDEHPLLNVEADDNGNITSTEFAPDEHDIGIRFYLTAYGEASQARTTFRDTVNITITAPTFTWHRTGEVPGGFNVTGVQGTYTCNTSGAAANSCTSVSNITIQVSGDPAHSKTITGLASPATGAAWGPVTLEFRASPGPGQFAIPAADGRFDVTATLSTNAPSSPAVGNRNNYFGVDNTDPQTDIQCNGSPCVNPYSVSVAVKLSADDGNSQTSSGVASTLYCVDTSNTCTPGTTYPGGPGFAVVYSAGVTYYVRYFSTDTVGNDETINSQPIVFTAPNSAPSVAFTTSPATANEGDTKTYNFSITDPDAGQTFTFVASFPDCGTGGSLVSSSINSTLKTGTFQCSFPDGPANPTVRVQVQDSFSTPANSNIASVAVTVANVAPTVTLAGPTSADEGQTKSYSYTTNDPGAETFTHVAACGTSGTLSNDVFNTGTGAGSFNCTFPDGPASSTVKITVDDGDGGSDDDTVTVTVANVSPTATLGNNGPVNEGSPVTVSFSAQFDPSSTDTSAGFHYAYACDNGSLASATYASSGASASTTCTYPDNGPQTVKARIIDKDDGFTEYTTAVTVNNVPPTATLGNNGPVNEGSAVTVSFSGQFDPSSTDTTAGFHYAYACDNGSLASATYVSSGTNTSTTCTYPDNGSQTVKARIIDKDDGFTEYTTAVTVNNVAPTATLSNNGPVNEGSAVTVSFSNQSDPSSVDTAAGFHYAYSCSGPIAVVTYAAAGTSSTATCTFGDNGTMNVKGRIFDKDDGYTEYSTDVVVNNVAPSNTGTSFTFNPFTGVANASVSFSDPGWLDVVSSTFNWAGVLDAPTSIGPGAAPGPLTGTFNGTHTFSGCIAGAISVHVSDDDLGSFDHTFAAANTLGVFTAAFMAPIKDGARNIVKLGNVLPVKVVILDCNGTPVLNRNLTIVLVSGTSAQDIADGVNLTDATSVSSADSGNSMRLADGQYIYNLATKGLPTGVPFTIIIRDAALPVGSQNILTAAIELKK